ncbi:MAG: hypothetical protein ACO1Q7_14055 [Gemmatimonas sp.]
MGFESAYAARRRLALVAESNEYVQQVVQDALAPETIQAATPALRMEESTLKFRANGAESHRLADTVASGVADAAPPAVAINPLDELAHDILATPGAGGALLAAFAAQARALSLVMEAARRTQGAAALPAEVMMAVQSALQTPAQMGLRLA